MIMFVEKVTNKAKCESSGENCLLNFVSPLDRNFEKHKTVPKKYR